MFEFLSKLEFKEVFWTAMLLGLTVVSFNITFDASSVTDTTKTFLLVLPEYIAGIMVSLFSFSFVLSLILVVIIIYLANQIIKNRNKMDEIFPKEDAKSAGEEIPKAFVNEKWEKVIKHINSDNPSDWKLAILECDIMLGDILDRMGYTQSTIGEKLKAVEPSDFTNIESAWEAHKIRNSIAHEGSGFVINEREAKRVIGLYEVCFREFSYI